MIKNTMALLFVLLVLPSIAFAKDFYTFTAKSIDGEELKFDQFRGKVVLVVNIATRCGFTSQLEGLEKLYQSYKDKGLVVLGVPSNDFGEQTPEDNKEVQKFCKINYGVTFPLTEKVKVKGKDKVDFIAWLVGQSKGDEIGWNFVKFVVDREGKFKDRFSSVTGPSGDKIEKLIKKLL